MKKMIKKILKEEGEMDWARNVDPIDNYLQWLNTHHRDVWKREFEDVINSMGWISDDASSILIHARILEDMGQSKERRLKSLGVVESYINMSHIIDNNKLYFKYVVDYSIHLGIDENTVVQIARKILENNLNEKSN